MKKLLLWCACDFFEGVLKILVWRRKNGLEGSITYSKFKYVKIHDYHTSAVIVIYCTSEILVLIHLCRKYVTNNNKNKRICADKYFVLSLQ